MRLNLRETLEAAQIGELLQTTVANASRSPSPERQRAAKWWEQKLRKAGEPLRQHEEARK